MAYIYVPPVIITEMEDIMREENLTVKAEALRKVASYSKLGREIQRKVDPEDLGKLVPSIPLRGSMLRVKKLKFKDVINL